MENIRSREAIILQLNKKGNISRMHKSIKLGSVNHSMNQCKKGIITPDSKATLANT